MNYEAFLMWVQLVTSIVSVVGMGALAFGYRTSLFSEDPATKWFSWSFVLIAGGFFFRRAFWDFFWPIFVTGNGIASRPVNILFNLVALVAVYCGLRARLLLIPREERHKWRWWTCWAHPGILRLRRAPAASE